MAVEAFAVRSSSDGVVSIISVAGEVDIATVGVLALALERARSDAQHILVDLSDTSFLESSGLRALLMAAQNTSRSETFSIACPRANVRRVFELTGTAQLFALHDDRDTALAWHGQRSDRLSALRA